MRILAAFAAFAACLMAGPALSAPVTWTIPPTTLPNGDVISGTFEYDADTALLSNPNVIQTGSDPGTYGFVGGAGGANRILQRADWVGFDARVLTISLSGIPANGGNFVSPFISVGSCSGVSFGGLCLGAQFQIRRDLVAMSAPAPVPTLSEWAMILLGLTLAGGAALLVQRRRFA